MLDIKNIICSQIANARGRVARFETMKGLLDTRASALLRLLATKNNINRASDYHYLNLPVTDSTEPVNGIDYIHPVVKPTVDYATAVIAKGIAPNGDINFEFVADGEEDADAARQATDMVSQILNQQNAAHSTLQHWIQDAVLHKNGEMLISPVREQIVRYVTTQGKSDQLAAFEAQARNGGLTVQRQARRKIEVDMAAVTQELNGFRDQIGAANSEEDFARQVALLDNYAGGDFEEEGVATANTEIDFGDDFFNDAVKRHTVYEAQYKLTGYSINIRFRPIPQHYWICDPTIVNIQDQTFCGFYEPMSVAEAMERWPDIDMEKFVKHADYTTGGSLAAGGSLNNLSLHSRDSVPAGGMPLNGQQSEDAATRQVTVLTVWNRYDIDNDGELELIETIYSGDYVISAKEVEFIPVANMVPKPLAQNFYGMSIAESVIPAQEYATAGHRAEIQLGLLTATPRLGVKPDKVDFEQLQDGEASIFILDSKFDPSADIYPVPPPSGNIAFMEQALNRIQNDVMSMVGMTSPSDVFNPEVMAAGNSGAKLQLAMSPNQIIQDNTIKNCAEGLREAIWLVWRTLIQYADDYGVRRLAQNTHPQGESVFLDAQAFDDMNFGDRKLIHTELALGMKSEENQLARLQIIKQTQQGLFQETQALLAQGALTPGVYAKVKRPYEDTLYVLGVKDADTYLPSDEEVVEMIERAQAAQAQKGPSAQEAKDRSTAELNQAKAQQIQADLAGESAERQMEAIALMRGKTINY